MTNSKIFKIIDSYKNFKKNYQVSTLKYLQIKKNNKFYKKILTIYFQKIIIYNLIKTRKTITMKQILMKIKQVFKFFKLIIKGFGKLKTKDG